MYEGLSFEVVAMNLPLEKTLASTVVKERFRLHGSPSQATRYCTPVSLWRSLAIASLTSCVPQS